MKKLLVILVFLLTNLSCKKNFLEEKTDKSLFVPSQLSDFRSILDHSLIFNQTPYLPAISNDDIYLNNAGYNALLAMARNAYVWKKDDFYDATVNVPDWNNSYQAIYYANVVLDGLLSLKSTTPADMVEANKLQGEALFHRSFAYHNLVQSYAKPFEKHSAELELGLPIRLSSDVKTKSERATLKATYELIINDLKASIPLLPKHSTPKTRPKQDAAYALLARVLLIMGYYEESLVYANLCLQSNGTLIDYNSLPLSAARPFPSAAFRDSNPEIIFFNTILSVSFLNSANTFVNPDLYHSYHTNDLRKIAFFNPGANGVLFKGNYTGNTGVFSGLANDEVFLIKAECLARLGQTNLAMKTLNELLKLRWDNKVVYEDLKALDANDALSKILIERRKELVYRNSRWSDLKRLNLDFKFQTTLKRTLNNQDYFLPPNDPRYVFPIPYTEIFNSGIKQNER